MKPIYLSKLVSQGDLVLTPDEQELTLNFAQHICYDGPWPSLYTSINAHYLRMKLRQERDVMEQTPRGFAPCQRIVDKVGAALKRHYARCAA